MPEGQRQVITRGARAFDHVFPEHLILATYFGPIAIVLGGAVCAYLGWSFERSTVGDKMAPEKRERLGKRLRFGGPFLMVIAVVLAIQKTLLAV